MILIFTMATTLHFFVENHWFIPFASNLLNKLEVCYDV